MEETSGLERTSVGVRTARDGHETCRQFKPFRHFRSHSGTHLRTLRSNREVETTVGII